MFDHLLPSNATAFERAASLSMDASARVAAGISAMRTAKLVAIPDAWLPFLIYEYGLGPVSAYVPDQRSLIGTGIDWQRVRGTPEAVDRGLAWLSYAGEIEEAPVTRRRWNLFQIELDRVRDAEAPDLDSIEGIAALSVPVRSRFFRGHSGYDVRELEWSRRKWSGARYSGSSGVRLRDDGAKWSFGRGAIFNIEMLKDDLVALNAWQDLLDAEIAGWGLPWAQTFASSDAVWGNFSWIGTGATWEVYTQSTRRNLIASALAGRPVWAAYREAGGGLIGYRRARVATPVVPSPSGPYVVGGGRLAPAQLGEGFYLEFLTDFADGEGKTAASVSLLWDAIPIDTSRPGLQWADPDQLTPGIEVASRPVNIQFGRTVRERLRYHLTF